MKGVSKPTQNIVEELSIGWLKKNTNINKKWMILPILTFIHYILYHQLINLINLNYEFFKDFKAFFHTIN